MRWEHLGSLNPPAEQGHPESFKLASMARAKGVGGPTEKKTLDFICSTRNVSQEMVRTRVGKSPPPAWHHHPTLRKAEGGLAVSRHICLAEADLSISPQRGEPGGRSISPALKNKFLGLALTLI